MVTTLIRDSNGGVYPVRKILKISEIREMEDRKFGFTIFGSANTSDIASTSRKGAIKRLNLIRKAILKVRLGVKGWDNDSVEYASYFVDPNDPQAGFTIPIWSIEHVGAVEKRSTSFDFCLYLSDMNSRYQIITFEFGEEGSKYKTQKEARAALLSCQKSLFYYMKRVGDLI